MYPGPEVDAEEVFDSEGGAGVGHQARVTRKCKDTREALHKSVTPPCIGIKDRFWYRSRLFVDI